jgi:hypothetical protein
VEEDDMKVSRRREKAISRAEAGRRFGLTLVMIALTATLGRSQPDSKLTVRVYNYAHLSDATLASAEAEARRIFGGATGTFVESKARISGGKRAVGDLEL